MIWPFASRTAAQRVDRIRDGADAAAFARLHATAFAHPWDAHAFEQMLLDPGTVAHALRAGAAIQGFALSRQILDEAEILTVLVAGAVRGRGGGTLLLSSHLSGLAAAFVRVVHLEVEAGNAPARALYRRFGFRDVGRREGYYLQADGTRAAALTMSLTLA